MVKGNLRKSLGLEAQLEERAELFLGRANSLHDASALELGLSGVETVRSWCLCPEEFCGSPRGEKLERMASSRPSMQTCISCAVQNGSGSVI